MALPLFGLTRSASRSPHARSRMTGMSLATSGVPLAIASMTLSGQYPWSRLWSLAGSGDSTASCWWWSAANSACGTARRMSGVAAARPARTPRAARADPGPDAGTVRQFAPGAG